MSYRTTVHEEGDTVVPVIIAVTGFRPTDELYVEFYECPACGFERIPHQQATEYAKAFGPAEDDITAKFCPGCGLRIVWTQE